MALITLVVACCSSLFTTSDHYCRHKCPHPSVHSNIPKSSTPSCCFTCCGGSFSNTSLLSGAGKPPRGAGAPAPGCGSGRGSAPMGGIMGITPRGIACAPWRPIMGIPGIPGTSPGIPGMPGIGRPPGSSPPGSPPGSMPAPGTIGR